MNTPREKILVRGVNWLGDAVMSAPALHRLREARPQAHLTLLTREKLADLWLHCPGIDRVLAFTDGESPWSVARRLRVENFQTALVMPSSPRSALEVWLAGVPQRVGYARAWRNWLLTQRVPERPGTVSMRKRSVAEIERLIREPSPPPAPAYSAAAHHIHHYLHLAAALGAVAEPIPPRLVVTDDEVAAVKRRFAMPSAAGTSRPWFGLNAGAEYGPAKRWPRERFIAAAIEVQRRTDCRWLIFGGKAEKELAAAIAAEIERAASERLERSAVSDNPVAMNLAGSSTLRELCAALKACRVLLTNDTGPMHVAAAVGTPVVAPFGSTSPELTGPGLPGDTRHHLLKSEVTCAPCFRRECPIDFRCMHSISVERVVAAVLEAAGTVPLSLPFS